MGTYEILRSAHSGWRYVVIVLLFVAIVQALLGWTGDKSYTAGHKKLNMFTLISAHIQLLVGLVLYFFSPLTKLATSDAIGRYWKMEHLSIMILAVILITIGNAQSKKITDELGKHRTIAVYFGIAFLLVVVAIYLMVDSDPTRTWYGIN